MCVNWPRMLALCKGEFRKAWKMALALEVPLPTFSP